MIWSEQVSRRARMIHDQIVGVRQHASDLGISPEEATSSLYQLLENIYLEDFPVARAKDNSDLLLHVEGEAVENHPRLSLVSSIFDNVKIQVRDLTKAISGIQNHAKVSVRDIDLVLSGLARGSLFVGFKVPLPEEIGNAPNLLGGEEPLFKATKEALNVIDMVSHNIESSSQETEEHISEIVDDPKIRDAAFLAVKRIAPSGRRGVERIGVSGKIAGLREGNLTPAVRAQINEILAQPTVGKELVEFEGTVREMDLDAKRFDLRGISNESVQDIRCVYSKEDIPNARALLDSRVRVSGYVARRSDEAPRLLSLERIKILRLADNERSAGHVPNLFEPFLPKLPRR